MASIVSHNGIYFWWCTCAFRWWFQWYVFIWFFPLKTLVISDFLFGLSLKTQQLRLCLRNIAID